MSIKLEVIDTFDFHQAPIYALIQDEDGMYSAGGDRQIIRYQQEIDGYKAAVFATTTGSTFALHIHDNLLFSGGIDGNLNVYDKLDKQILHRFQCHEKGIYAIASNHQFLITGGGDGKIHLWDIATLTIVRTIWTGSAKIRKFIWNLEKNELAVLDNEGYFRLFETTWWNEIKTIKHDQGWTSGLFHAQKGVWILGSKLGQLMIYQEPDLHCILSIQAHTNAIYQLAWNKDRHLFITGSLDKSVKFWSDLDLDMQLKIEKINGSTLRSVNAIDIWNDVLLVAGDDKKIHALRFVF